MKIAITGSMGFVGSYAVNFFSNSNEILAFNRQKTEKRGNINYINWDLRYQFSDTIDFDIFIHCAADTGYEKNKLEMFKNNVTSIKNILEVVNNSSCKHFVYVSSSSVYQGLAGIIDESVEINENNLLNSYSLTKYLAEQSIIHNLKENIKLTILRPRAIYGVGDRVLEPNILKHQIFNKLILLGNGNNITSLTSIENFIYSIDLVINEQKTPFEIYNVSDEETETMENIYLGISKKHNFKGIIKVPINLLKLFKFLNKNKISYLIDSFEPDKILNIGKIKSLLHLDN